MITINHIKRALVRAGEGMVYISVGLAVGIMWAILWTYATVTGARKGHKEEQ